MTDEPRTAPQPTGLVAQAVDEAVPVASSHVDKEQPAVHARHRVKAGSLLAARAATEYVYVAQDMRRILVVSVLLATTLIVLWLLIVVLRVIELPFY